MSNSPPPPAPIQAEPKGASEQIQEASESPRSSAIPLHDIDLVTIDQHGHSTHTRVVELVRPNNHFSRLSVVAVTKTGKLPYLAQADLSGSDIQAQVDSQDPSISEQISHGISAIPPQRASNDDFLVSNRMIKIPLQSQPMTESVVIDRNPDYPGPSKEGGRDSVYSNSRDPEKDAPVKNATYAPGYPSTAAIMSTDPELSVYRRFDRINARNFLYYQAELMYMEAELDKMDEEDRLLDEPEAKYRLKHFKELWDATDSRSRKRRDLVMDMRYLLKEYNQSMYYYKDLINCPEPSKRVVTSIRNWRANQGDPPINDISETAYDKNYEVDLMALKPPKCDDPLSIFVQNNLGRFFKKPQPAHIPNSDNVLYYSETAIDLFVTIICTLLAIVVLVGSMTTLYFIESQGLRLGLVWVFTFLFAVSIFLMAKLTKGEIFLATAAYCAILVVYISGG